MKVYVVSEICDNEYFCTEVVFVTADKEIAKEYCDKYNVKYKGWDDRIRNTISYQEYELENIIPTRR